MAVPVRRLAALALLASLPLVSLGLAMPVHAQVDRRVQIDTRCFCAASIGVGIGEAPLNVRHLVDGIRYDLTTLTMTLAPEIGDPTRPGSLPQSVRAEPFFSTSMQLAIPEVDLLVGRKYGIGAQPKGTTQEIRLGSSFIVRDSIDTTAPTAEDLRLTGEVFENDCGAKALYLEGEGIGDDFFTGSRYPILVTLKAGEKEFQTVTATFGNTQTTRVVVAKAPYLGDCITDEGLETLDFELGEPVEVTMVVYDYAGNASAPVTQTIEWPIGILDSPMDEGGGCGLAATGTGQPSAWLALALLMTLLAACRLSGR